MNERKNTMKWITLPSLLTGRDKVMAPFGLNLSPRGTSCGASKPAHPSTSSGRTGFKSLSVGSIGCLLAFSLSVLADEVPPQPPTQAVVLPAGVTEEMLAPPPVPKFMLDNSGPKAGKTVPPDDLEARKKARKASAPLETGGDEPDRKTQVDAQ